MEFSIKLDVHTIKSGWSITYTQQKIETHHFDLFNSQEDHKW